VLPNKINWLSIINNLADQKNNEVAAQNYEFSCPNLRQPFFSGAWEWDSSTLDSVGDFGCRIWALLLRWKWAGSRYSNPTFVERSVVHWHSPANCFLSLLAAQSCLACDYFPFYVVFKTHFLKNQKNFLFLTQAWKLKSVLSVTLNFFYWLPQTG
jgi:hypothetical protein